MKKIGAFFTNRWVLAVLGLTGLALLIWFVGPLIAIAGREPLVGTLARLLTILVVIIVWLLVTMIRLLRANKANRELAEGIVQPNESAAPETDLSAEEVAALKERFEEAIAVLQKSRGKNSSLNLYELPWYVIIGPPGAGKTTALRNSGLNFPLEERFGKEALRGVGGTRDCDWWFTNEAVLLDTAGRYTTQDSHQQVDSAAWDGFLNLLRRYRKRRPINGLLVAISLSDLMLLDERQRAGHAEAIRQRITELYEFFGIRFPVYVLITKCDLVAGFMDFFDDLGQNEREQVWGATLPFIEIDQDFDLGRAFENEYDLLLQRLNDRLLERLARERDVRRRAAIYGFPRQMAALRETLREFLLAAFRGSRYEDMPLLRGVYFTSGTQEGTPIDRVMGSLARTFGLSAQAMPSYGGQGRSFFLTSLLGKVVFREAGVAGTNRKVEKQRAWLQRGAYAGTIALAVLAVTVWIVSYLGNRGFVATAAAETQAAQQILTELTPQQSRAEDARIALTAVRELPGGYSDQREATPLALRFGLYQGDRLGSAATSAYRRVLGNVFLPRLTLRLEQQLRQEAGNPELLFQGLKTYLMLEDPEHFDADTIKAWILLDWEQNLPRGVTTEQRNELAGHLDALLENMPATLEVPLDRDVIARSRQVLRRIPLEQQVYLRIKNEGLGKDLPEFKISEAAGPEAVQVFVRKSGAPLNRGIPGLYTYDGYWEAFSKHSEEQVARLSEDSWILGAEDESVLEKLSGAGQEALNEKVTQLYLEDYARQWEDLIFDIELAPFMSIEQAKFMLEVLSGEKSPLRRLLVAVQRETALDRVPDDENESLLKAAGEGVQKASGRISGAASRVRTALMPPRAQRAMYVANRFDSLNRMVEAPEGGTSPLDGLLARLDELYIHLAGLAQAADQGEDALKALARSGGSSGVVNELKLSSARLPGPLKEMMSDLAESTTSLTAGSALEHLNANWVQGPLAFCKRAIANRYPLTPGADVDAALADFARFFQPDGEMDKFFKGFLAGFIDTTRTPWQWRAAGGEGIAPASIEQFRRAAVIRDAFFQLGAGPPSVSFDLTPISMDANIETFTLELEGQRLMYDHGPIVPTPLNWPGPKPRQVLLQMAPQLPGVQSVAENNGPWAFFRLLDKAAITPTPRPEVFQVDFVVGGRSARYQLRAGSAFNPFNLQELRTFRCPERL